ncbi:MAG: tyrosine-type recombinase/integrase [Nocardioides sp.]|uniref:tyrosine-type recombinase/integrase n=1 Tax=Nocardioides sp. TaxID=35761 RepID=UPI003D6B3D65
MSPAVDIKLPWVEAKAALVPITTDVVVSLREQMSERLRAFVTIAAGTGMRRGELLGLTIDRVATDFGAIRVDRQLSRKSTGKNPIFAPPKTTASVRTIPVAQVVLDTIEHHVGTYGVHRETGLLFTTDIRTPLSTSTLQAAWSKAAKAAHTDATPHALRHYYASIQIYGGCSIKQLQANLGHKSARDVGHLRPPDGRRGRPLTGRDRGRPRRKDQKLCPQ